MAERAWYVPMKQEVGPWCSSRSEFAALACAPMVCLGRWLGRTSPSVLAAEDDVSYEFGF